MRVSLSLTRALVVLLVALALGSGVSAEAGQTEKRYAGRLLTDVLRDLQDRGLKIVFSTELVRADMRVATEPRGTAPRKILDEVLRPYGLQVRTGPGQYGSEVRNLARLPVYARLDVRANHTFNYTKRRLTLFVEVLNLLGRENLGQDRGAVFPGNLRAFGFTESLFPFLPSAGFIIDF